MRGPIPYIGGKNRLAKRIIERIPEHHTYVELFAGGARVLFQKPPSNIEVLNDLDNDITNFFRVCQNHYQELIRCIAFHVASRNWFDLHLRTAPETLTDIQRAVRFFYLQKIGYGAKLIRRNFAYGVESKPRLDATKIPQAITQTHQRLARVQIECLPYEDVLRRYDRKETFFYCDPPYYGIPIYAFNFSHRDFELLRDRLTAIKGKFLLSVNDVPETRGIFRDFKIERIPTSYTLIKSNKKRTSELLIRNY